MPEEKENLKTIYGKCHYCAGTGVIHRPLGDEECENCEGTGKKLWGWIDMSS